MQYLHVCSLERAVPALYHCLTTPPKTRITNVTFVSRCHFILPRENNCNGRNYETRILTVCSFNYRIPLRLSTYLIISIFIGLILWLSYKYFVLWSLRTQNYWIAYDIDDNNENDDGISYEEKLFYEWYCQLFLWWEYKKVRRSDFLNMIQWRKWIRLK